MLDLSDESVDGFFPDPLAVEPAMSVDVGAAVAFVAEGDASAEFA